MAPLERMVDCLMLPEDPNSSLNSVSSTETNTNVVTPLKSLFEPLPIEKPKKFVRFSEYSVMYSIPNLDSFMQQELEDCFMTDEDYDRIHRENSITLSYMENGIYPDDDNLYFRGLESGMQHIYTEKKRLSQAAVKEVLRRQADKKDLTDEAWVNHYYGAFTYQSIVNAFRIGAYDAQANGR
jgi:hypothetical protein